MEYLTDEQILEKLDNLPQDLMDAVFGFETRKIIIGIGEKYKLGADKISELENETGMVIVGFTHPSDFIPNLIQRLGVDGETAGKIIEDVNAQIFAKVKESLEKIHGAEPTTVVGLEKKEEILKEIEKDHAAEIVSSAPVVSIVEPHYPAGDPYREPVK